MSETLHLLALIGSLRKKSFNRMTYHAVSSLLPEATTLEEAELGSIPPYDDDVRVAGYPEPARKLREQIRAADAVLVISPEYNFSVPGLLKNALDWASRPPDQPFAGKPVGIMGASAGVTGTLRMQYHLRQILLSLDAHTMNRPEVAIARAQDKFDAEGNLLDEATRKQIRAHLEALAAWTLRLRQDPLETRSC